MIMSNVIVAQCEKKDRSVQLTAADRYLLSILFGRVRTILASSI